LDIQTKIKLLLPFVRLLADVNDRSGLHMPPLSAASIGEIPVQEF
jgi:hypothetical protein